MAAERPRQDHGPVPPGYTVVETNRYVELDGGDETYLSRAKAERVADGANRRLLHRRTPEAPLMAAYVASMRFHDLDGMVYCTPCKDGLLVNADRALAAYAGHDVSNVELVRRPRDFEAVGPRPWAGNDEGERYIQCDGCMCQWGPDA